MEGILKVNPEQLKATASSFGTTGSSVSNLTTQMTSMVNSISGTVWSGEAANAYKQKFAGLEDDIQKINKMIQEHVEDLNAMADAYIQAEQQNISESQSLSSDVIV